mmetsp:Transcript_11119/g.17053  ORF Transcript_11119/g.17053 Transcript_11119/m.17053 type:complete len:167 (-) Transcript_11119:186-686(-)
MGKKSRRNRSTQERNTTTTNAAQPLSQSSLPPANDAAPIYYPSDGPSDVELLQTTSDSLQAKLNQLTHLGLVDNDQAGFVEQFVPLDLSPSDKARYLADLTTAPEAAGQWTNLIAEIAAIRSGKGVDRIEGDQVNRAIFYFEHPLLEKCDREVSFVCVGGEWRAQG